MVEDDDDEVSTRTWLELSADDDKLTTVIVADAAEGWAEEEA